MCGVGDGLKWFEGILELLRFSLLGYCTNYPRIVCFPNQNMTTKVGASRNFAENKVASEWLLVFSSGHT